MAQRGTPLRMSVRLEIKRQTAAGARVKPLARELSVSRNTVKKYRSKYK